MIGKVLIFWGVSTHRNKEASHEDNTHMNTVFHLCTKVLKHVQQIVRLSRLTNLPEKDNWRYGIHPKLCDLWRIPSILRVVLCWKWWRTGRWWSTLGQWTPQIWGSRWLEWPLPGSGLAGGRCGPKFPATRSQSRSSIRWTSSLGRRKGLLRIVLDFGNTSQPPKK